MRNLPGILIIMAAQFAGWNVFGQGTLQNLNFESANGLPNLGPAQTAFVPFGNALPGWTGYVGGTNQATQALYNSISAGGALISLIGRSSGSYSNAVIAGNYTATLDAGEFTDMNGVNYFAPAAIAQAGTVPATAQSLRFAAAGNVAGALAVTFNGQNVNFYPLSAGANYEIYGADISAFAGQTGELRFTENSIVSNPFAIATLDNIIFSTSSIPEPGTCGLILCGAVVFGVNRWRKRHF